MLISPMMQAMRVAHDQSRQRRPSKEVKPGVFESKPSKERRERYGRESLIRGGRDVDPAFKELGERFGSRGSSQAMPGTGFGSSGPRLPTTRSTTSFKGVALEDFFQDHSEFAHQVLDFEDDSDPRLPRELQWIPEDTMDNALGTLAYVETNSFQLFAGLVILCNVVIIGQELLDPSKKVKYFYVDQAMLAFYVFELLSRIGHFKLRYFYHKADWYWNWMDFLIVVSGVIDQWILPALHMESQTNIIQILRVLRIFRLLRILKLLKVIVRADFSWTEGGQFQTFVGIVIAMNAAIMGMETDIESPIWWWIEQALLCFFVFELAARLRLNGWRFFYHPDDRVWNWLDFVIVSSGVLDQWLMPLWEFLSSSKGAGHQLGQMMMLMRMLRLMRILRLLRLVKAVRPLYNLAMGIMLAMQSMFWILVLTMVALYACSILSTRLIGHSEWIPWRTRKLFTSVGESMFTLFGLMNGQQWIGVEPLLELVPSVKLVFVIFTVYSSWALLSVMTGVVSDNMLASRQMQEAKDEEALEARRVFVQQNLSEIFAAADKDGSGALEKHEYLGILSSEYHIKKLQKVAPVTQRDLIRMFDWLDTDGSGEIEFSEFLHGFDWLNEPVTGKSLLKIDSAVKQKTVGLGKQVRHLGEEVASMAMRHRQRRAEVQNCLRRGREKLREQPHAPPVGGPIRDTLREQLRLTRVGIAKELPQESEIFDGGTPGELSMMSWHPPEAENSN